ncbi:GNAT family N-acetyltransferase [Marinomonas mediterranea]|uniref:GNAT family N-acetyltransferase n=1 Tax=Marinomonas mediterranea TaxID=119864 RepID=UPI0023496567|nr:GNAT family N-acetyltransferase [Marinomonas mediterranea]WCN13891.1 GNAT family N-acetyltransferase [Marinomonas mediterranea]
MEIKKVPWQDTISIRHQVLWPDKTPEFCHVEGDDHAFHYGAFIHGKLVCVASIFITDKTARLRKFATLDEHQGKGIGSAILTHILNELNSLEIKDMWFDARDSVAGFYQKFGFDVMGEPFFKGDILYVKMGADLVDVVKSPVSSGDLHHSADNAK